MPKSNLNYLRGIIAASILAVGLFYELACALASAALVVWLFLLNKKQRLTYRRNASSLAAIAIYACYCLTVLWAVDKGLSVWGICKYLPVVLMALCLLQTEPDDRQTIVKDIPWIGGFMVIVSFALHFIPELQGFFTARDRLSGFFQYPNTFACFLLLGVEILLLSTDKLDIRRIVCGLVLIFGIIQSGSRTVFLLAIPALLICLIIKLKKSPKTLLISAGAAVAVLAAVLIIFKDTPSVSRLLSLSISDTSLAGRLLYWKDALPVIGNHPFGLGYLGYYMSHGSFQNGLYAVRWVHNDLLQLLLDIGWIPTVIAIVALVKSVLSKRVPLMLKVVLLTLLAHSMADFDLEYIAMYFIVLLCLDWEEGRSRKLKTPAVAVAAVAALLLGSVYIGIGSSLFYAGNNEAAVEWYPWNTQARMELLTQIDSAQEMDEAADEILRLNKYIALAWDAKAEVAFGKGDFKAVIDAKHEALDNTKYIKNEYVDYFNKLAIGYELYMRAGDTKSAEICLDEIEGIQDRIDKVLAQTDELAWKVSEKPYLVMPDEYNEFLKTHNR